MTLKKFCDKIHTWQLKEHISHQARKERRNLAFVQKWRPQTAEKHYNLAALKVEKGLQLFNQIDAGPEK